MGNPAMEHVVVFRREDLFCAWPFNGGFWMFADGELAVGFIRGRCDYASEASIGHQAVDNAQGEHVILRSRDGGLTWPADTLSVVYRRPEYDARARAAPRPDAAVEVLDPRTDGFCLIAGYGIPPLEDPTTMFVTVSRDRGRTWRDPVRIRSYGFQQIGGRPSYVVRPDGTLLLFAHASRNREEGRSVPIVLASPDGGGSWGLLAEFELKPALPMGIMPYPLLLPDGRILAAVRRQWDMSSAYTQVYASADDGRSWDPLSRVNDFGAPASLTLLPDGRVACIYGYRRWPWGIRAAVSGDWGATWSREIVLRDDGGSADLGYPRTLLRADGTLVTVYYHNLRSDPVQQRGGVRHIAATLWRP